MKYLTLLFSLTAITVMAQESIVMDSIPEESQDKFQVYVAPGYSLTQFVGTNSSFAEVHVGLVYLKKIDLDLNYAVNLDNFQKQIIFPSVHYYDQKNIGVRAHYSFLKKSFRLHAGAGYQYVEAMWSPEEEKNDTFVDQMSFVEFYGGVSWLINKSFTLQGDAGYTFVNGVELVGFETNDFGGFKALIMLKIGIINF